MIMSPCIRNMALGSDFLFLTIFSQSLCLLSQPSVFRQSFRKARNQRTHCRQVPTQTLRHVFESITQPSDQHVSHQRSRSRYLPSTIRSAKHFRLHSHPTCGATKHHRQLFFGPPDLFLLGLALERFSKPLWLPETAGPQLGNTPPGKPSRTNLRYPLGPPQTSPVPAVGQPLCLPGLVRIPHGRWP